VGPLIVPFQVQQASSVEFGQLADAGDISNFKFARGTVSTQPEAWASLQFLHRDLITHDGRIPESTFLRILPDQVEAMLNYFKMVLSVHLMGRSGAFAEFKANGLNTGVVLVNRIDRFTLDQKCTINDNGTAGPRTFYVIGIDVNNYLVTLSTTRGGAAADVSMYTTANNAKFFHPGSLTGGMTSLGSQLLPFAQGGTQFLFGQDKLSAPFLQTPAVDGSSVTATNILQKVFDAYTTRLQMAKSGELSEVMISYKHFGNILKQLEVIKGNFNVVPQSRKISVYGWQEVTIGSVSGALLKFVAISEQPDDLIYFLDWSGIMFYSNGLIRRRKSPDGIEYHETRTTAGYSYIIDHCIFGDLVVTAPWKQLIMYGINYT
jgi:hypothetical protein